MDSQLRQVLKIDQTDLRKFLLTAFSGVMLAGCSTSVNPIVEVVDPPLIQGLAEPVQLELELTRIPMNRYVNDPTRIDSITTDGPFNYEVDNSSIVLLGRPQKPLYVLQLWSGGICENILLKRTKPKLHSFLYIGEANNVAVKGDFNDWSSDGLKLKKNGRAFSEYALLRPGRYEYRFEIDGIEMLDPLNRDSVSADDGWNSVLTIPGQDVRKSPVVDLVSTSRNSITVSLKKITGTYVFWQNRLLSSEFLVPREGEVEIQIPSNAVDIERSTIRLWAENAENRSEVLEIALRFGKVVVKDE